jgi:Amt family ammonium transporter
MIIMYAGLSKAKWAINSAFMGLYAFSITLVIWVLYAYNSELALAVPSAHNTVAFGKEWFPLCGVPSPVLGMRTALNQSGIPALGTKQNFNLATLV